MTGRPPREHDPRITVIQQELFDENRSKADKYRELFVGRPGLWRAARATKLAMLLASWVPGALGLVLRSKLYPLDPRLGRPQRRVRRQRDAAPSAQDPHRRQRRDRRPVLPRRQGHRQHGHHDRQRRVRRPQHDPELQERRHRHRGPRQHRLQLRDLLGLARARRQEHPDGGLHLSGRRRSPVRSHRHPGAAAGPDRARHRRRRRHLARHARGGHRWIDHRPRCHHRRRRGRGRRDSGVRDRDRHPGEGDAGSAGTGSCIEAPESRSR